MLFVHGTCTNFWYVCLKSLVDSNAARKPGKSLTPCRCTLFMLLKVNNVCEVDEERKGGACAVHDSALPGVEPTTWYSDG